MINDPYDLPEEPEPDQTTDITAPFYPKFVLKTGTEIISDFYISDGNIRKPWKSGAIKKAGPGIYSDGNQLTKYDAAATEIETITLNSTPTQIKSVNNSLYYCKEITPAEAYSMGGQAKFYSEFYKDDDIISDWYLNQMNCAGIVAADGQVFAVNQFGAYSIIEGTAANVMHVHDGEFYYHSLNTVTREFEFNNLAAQSYNMNYVHGSDQWIKYDGLFYSEKGDIWSEETGLLESVTDMKSFNSAPYPVDLLARPTLLSAGENDGKLYWIEANTGILFEFDPNIDTVSQKWVMYQGEGSLAYGIGKSDSLKPVLIDGKIYFSNYGSVNYLDLESGMVVVYYGGVGEIWAW